MNVLVAVDATLQGEYELAEQIALYSAAPMSTTGAALYLLDDLKNELGALLENSEE